jgi:hypothetical protein
VRKHITSITKWVGGQKCNRRSCKGEFCQEKSVEKRKEVAAVSRKGAQKHIQIELSTLYQGHL